MRTCFILLLFTCLTGQVSAETSAEALCVSLKEPASKLCVQYQLPENASTWFVENTAGVKQNLSAFQTAFMQVDSIKVSPDNKWFSVISSGEGHPILEIFLLKSVLGNATTVTPQLEINPFPGWIDIKGWYNGKLEVSTDRSLPLNLASISENTELPDIAESERCYQIDLANSHAARSTCHSATQ